MTETYLGIDPGQTGGLAILGIGGDLLHWDAFDHRDPLGVLDGVICTFAPKLVAIEEVHSSPGAGVVSMFKFGVGLGRVQGFLAGGGIIPMMVPPQTWQKWLPAAESSKARVRQWIAIKYGLQLFIRPGCRVPHQGGMDATAIAEYLRLVDQDVIKVTPRGEPRPKRRAIRLVE